MGIYAFMIIPLSIAAVAYMGIIHCTWRSFLKKEMGEHLAGNTSNGKARFSMQIREVKKGWTHTVVEGILLGRYPERGNVIYLCGDGVRKAVLVLRIWQRKDLAEEDAIYVRIKLFGAGKDLQPGWRINNLRLEEQIKEEETTFPIHIRQSYSQTLLGAGMFVVGAFMVILTITGFSNGLANALVAVIVGFSGALTVWAGIEMTKTGLTFSIEVSENGGIEIRQGKKVTRLQAAEVFAALNATNNGKVSLVFQGPGMKNHITLQENDPGTKQFITALRRWDRLRK